MIERTAQLNRYLDSCQRVGTTLWCASLPLAAHKSANSIRQPQANSSAGFVTTWANVRPELTNSIYEVSLINLADAVMPFAIGTKGAAG